MTSNASALYPPSGMLSDAASAFRLYSDASPRARSHAFLAGANLVSLAMISLPMDDPEVSRANAMVHAVFDEIAANWETYSPCADILTELADTFDRLAFGWAFVERERTRNGS